MPERRVTVADWIADVATKLLCVGVAYLLGFGAVFLLTLLMLSPYLALLF